MKAIDIIKKENIDFLLAVGGGSTLDGTKFIAAAACWEGDNCWDILTTQPKLKKAMPVASVITLPATASEMNSAFVLSNIETDEKLALIDPALYPQFSILDPETTYSLPKKQVINGIVDTFVHTTEQYLNKCIGAHLQDRQAEAILSVLVDIAPDLLNEKPDYDSRASFMWTATSALNFVIGLGVPGDWGVHNIGHELTAFYGLDHGQTLAIVLPALLRHQFETKKEKLAQMFRRVFFPAAQFGVNIAVPKDNTIDELAKTSIVCIENFFHSVGMATKLSDYNIVPDMKMLAERYDQRTPMGEEGSLLTADILKIIELGM